MSEISTCSDTVAFGVELNFLLQREAANGDVLPGAIPFVIERCLYEIESRGLSEVGICVSPRLHPPSTLS
jgi:hypothetical protein